MHRPHQHSRLLAWPHEGGGAGGPREQAGPAGRAARSQAVPGRSGGSPGLRLYPDEHEREPARPRQCRHADGHPCDAGAPEAESQPGHGDSRDVHAAGVEHRKHYPDPDDDDRDPDELRLRPSDRYRGKHASGHDRRERRSRPIAGTAVETVCRRCKPAKPRIRKEGNRWSPSSIRYRPGRCP